jgi:metal-sulfur cluster biosynthetic enzyme
MMSDVNGSKLVNNMEVSQIEIEINMCSKYVPKCYCIYSIYKQVQGKLSQLRDVPYSAVGQFKLSTRFKALQRLTANLSAVK